MCVHRDRSISTLDSGWDLQTGGAGDLWEGWLVLLPRADFISSTRVLVLTGVEGS